MKESSAIIISHSKILKNKTAFQIIFFLSEALDYIYLPKWQKIEILLINVSSVVLLRNGPSFNR